jgi:hypothetical protein
MIFYRLRGEYQVRITGSKDAQIKSPPDNYSHWAKNSVRNVGEVYNGYNADFIPNVPRMEINKKAKLLDLMQTEILGDFFNSITISDRLLDFIRMFNVEGYNSYKLPLFQRRGQIDVEINNYNIMSFYLSIEEFIDFDLSYFLITRYNFELSKTDVVERVKFDCLKHFNEFKSSQPFDAFGTDLKSELIVFKKTMNQDLFNIPHFGGYIISQRLKEAIEQEGFTGMRFEPADWIVTEG